MKRHFLLTTVSVLAIPFVVLTGSAPASAEDDGCAGMNFFQCQTSRAVYAVTHIGQPDNPTATLTTAPVVSKPATAPTMDELNSAATKINDLAITGIITADQAAQALKLVAAGGGNLVAAGGGNLVAAGGGNLVAAGGGNIITQDGGGIVAANALSLIGASQAKAQIAAALVSDGGTGLRAASQVVQQNMIAGFYDAGKITDTQAMALSKLVAAGGGNLVAAGGGNLVAAGGGNLVAAGGGNLVAAGGGNAISENGSGLVAAGGGNLVAAGGGNLVAAGGGNFTLTGAAANLVAAGGGNLISNGGAPLVAAGGGNLVAAGGGNLVAAGGGNLVAAGGGNLVAAGGGNLVSNAGGTLVAAGGGNIISDNSAGLAAVTSLLSEHGAGIVSAAGLSQRSLADVGGADKGVKVAALIQSVTGPSPAQLAAQKALTDAQKAVNDFSSAGDQLARDVQALQNVKAGGNQSAINQMQAKLDADSVAMVNAGGVMMDKSKQVSAGDVATVKKQLDDTVTHVGDNIQKATDAAKPQGPTQLQIDTANAAAAVAAKDAAAAKAANDAIKDIAVGAARPTDTAKLTDDNERLAAAALVSAKANLSKAQSDLVTMSKNGASANDIKGQQDLIAKAQANLNFQTVMTTKDANGQDYVVKAIAVDTTSADLAAAKSVVAGLTKAYGSNRPSDPTQLATINTAMVVQALAQDKADQAAAAAAAVRLTASGASKSDIQTQTDLVATKQNDMANILKANPKVAAMAGVAANADSKTVQAAINGLISNAASVSGAAVNLTAAQAAAALQALQQLQAGAGKTTATTTTGGTDITALLSTVTKAASTYSIQSLSDKPAGVTTQVASTSTTGPANATATQVANPATTGPTTNAATAVTAAAIAPAAPPVDKSELTPAVVQMLLTSGPATIAAMQSAQQAALAKGDKAMADGLGKDIVNLQAQVAAAKTMPQPVTTAAAATTTTSAATTTNPTAATISPTVVAATNPTSPATGAAATSAATSAGTATPTAKATDTQAPTKITAEQGKAVRQALRTVPGNLTKTEEKNLSTLSALVDRAATKGLTPDEAAQLKSGLAALAEKHPKAEKQIGLTKIANSVTVQKPVAGEAGSKPATAPAEGKVAVTAPPTANTPAEGKAAAATPATAAVPGGPAGVAKPTASSAPEGKVAVTTPATSMATTPAAMPGAAIPGAKVATPTVVQPQVTIKPEPPKPTVATTTPTVTPSVTHEMRHEAPVMMKPAPAPVVTHVEQPKVVVAPPARVAPPVVAAPRPTPAPAVVAAKPPAPPAAKPQTCTPNMVNGKMMGMTCH